MKADGDKRLTSAAIGGDAQALVRPLTTGQTGLIDGDGVSHLLNANITFSTTSSASGAMSDAQLTHATAASTLNGGTTESTLNDAYDGYQSLCVAVDNSVNAECATGDPNYVIYNDNGPPTADPTAGCTAEQVIFNPQTIDGLTVSREVFVPSNDAFGRWLDIVTNPGSSPATITLQTANNLGSDNNTKITGDSSQNTTPTMADTWVTSFQNYVAAQTTSSDLRLGHVFGGPGAATGLAGLFFADGNDKPYWGYTLTVAPGQTQIIANYGVTQASQAAANAKSAELASLSDPHQLDCTTPLQQAQVVNFKIPAEATADSYSTQHDTALNEPAPGILANDPNTEALTAQLVSGPSHAASFSLHADGSFAYTPAAGFAGTDSFTYAAVNEGGGTSPPTTVTLNVVGVAPAITSGATAALQVGTPGSFTVHASGLPTPALTEAGALPAGLAFHDNGDGTATISGTPSSGTNGNHAVTITAANGQGADATEALTLAIAPGTSTTPAPTPTPTPTSTGCSSATGALKGRSLGLIRLGMTRAQATSQYAESSSNGKPNWQFFCVSPRIIRAGYASPRLLKTLNTKQQNAVRGRIVLMLTANRYYSLKGVRSGTSLRTAAKRLHTGAVMNVGLNDWYMAPNGATTAVLKVRHGKVEEIGTATKMVTRGRSAQVTFIRSF